MAKVPKNLVFRPAHLDHVLILSGGFTVAVVQAPDKVSSIEKPEQSAMLLLLLLPLLLLLILLLLLLLLLTNYELL